MASPSLVDMAATDWDLVFKIKYGDALRRFGACVRGRVIDFTMGSLRSKIIVLFNFKPDADLTLTYIDEDGDVVTLMDDNDLHDAVILQRLNPLRITVQFNSNVTAGNSDARLPTPIQSYGPPKTHYSVDEFLNSMSEHVHLTGSRFEKALKHAPEPVHAAISKVSGDLQSLVSKSALPAAEIVEHLLKSVISSGTPFSGSHDAPLKEATSAPPTSGNVHPSSSMPATVPNVSSPTELNNCEQDGINTVVGMGTSVSMNRVNDNVPGNRKAVVGDPDSTLFPARGIAQLRRDAVRSRMEKSHAQETSSTIPSIQQTDQNTWLPGSHKVVSKQPALQVPTEGISGALGGDQNKHLSGDAGPYIPPHVYLPQGPPIVMPPPGFGYSPSRAFSPVSFHTGVHCDGCGVHPIMGSRYKSKVKEDYDLCSTCFSTMGNEPDYFKIDRPIRSLGFYPHYKAHMSASRAFRYGAKSIKPYKLKLESRFIQDISVLDGTLMAPGTRFTKIWRMLNNGNVEWPSGTQLVWIGGDQFGDTGSVLLEISSNGFPIGGEIDVAVDFTAPSRPGRYTSYWRMAAPSGQKFGQRVWVLIQVDNRSDIMVNGFHGVPKLNLPPENSGQKGKEIADVNAEPLEHSPSPVPDLSHITMEIIKPLTDGLSGDGTMEPMQVDELMASLSESGSPTAVSYPLIDLSVPASETTPFAPHPPMTTTEGGPSETGIDGNNTLEQILLKELEEMGFKQIDLNKEILRRNEYDLERSVDELCGIFEWDPLLVELEEMGFSDKEKNKEVLLKNGGSIKRAVMDLIAKEKGE